MHEKARRSFTRPAFESLLSPGDYLGAKRFRYSVD